MNGQLLCSVVGCERRIDACVMIYRGYSLCLSCMRRVAEMEDAQLQGWGNALPNMDPEWYRELERDLEIAEREARASNHQP